MSKKTTEATGYQENFLGNNFKIKLPELNTAQKKDLVKFDTNKFKLDYIHYSSVMCKSRRLAYFTAANIDGGLWQDNPRKGSWKKDVRIKTDEQWGAELYEAKKSNFDRGHLVRREDPEWGTKELSIKAGVNTFMFPNCTPQHLKLNQKIWAELEANILHLGADENDLKVNVFTGPVLADNDGIFVTKVKGEDIKIPNLFWKVVVWTKKNKKAYAVGFIMSQEKFLLEGGIIKKTITMHHARALKDEDVFEHLKFKDGKTYQVKLDEIEKLSGLNFNWTGIVKPFKKATPQLIKASKTKPKAIKKPKLSALAVGAPSKVLLIKRKLKLTGIVL